MASSNCPFSDDSELPLKDPFLDYINEFLMEEGMDDATYLQQIGRASYQAIFSGFQDILGEQLQHISHVDSPSRVHIFNPPILHKSMDCNHEDSHDEHHVKVSRPKDVLCTLTDELQNVGVPRVSLPADGHSQSSMHQEGIEVRSTLIHDLGFQGRASDRHNPLKSMQFPEHDEVTNGMHNSGVHLCERCLNKPSVTASSINNINVAEKYHNVICLNDGEPLNAMVSCLGKHTAVDGFNGHTSMGVLQQGDPNLMLSSVDKGLADLDLSFEGLNINDLYTDLYVGEPGSLGRPTRATRDSKSVGDKKEFMKHKGSKSIGDKKELMKHKGRELVRKSKSGVQGFVDVKEVLIDCAKAVAIGDGSKAKATLQELREVHGASADGTGLQRVAHFFSEALAARLRGMGEQHFRALSNNMPSTLTMMKASKLVFERAPFAKLIHYCANQSILKAAEGASRLHVVDFEFTHAMQWPCLINALADRKGGPPLLVITGIGILQLGASPAERLEGSGRRLAAYAKTFNVPFEFHPIVIDKWQDFDVASLHLHEGEVLVVNCIQCLRHLPDDSVELTTTIFHRQKFFTCMRNLNPHLLITVVLNAAFNSSFFVSRFRDALNYFCTVFDILEVLWGDNPARLILERRCFYRDIVNIVACEGSERVERPETYKQWHARITKAGFQQLPIPPTILSRSRSHVKQHYHDSFFIVDDDAGGWMLMGWKGRTTVAMSAWKPSLVRRY